MTEQEANELLKRYRLDQCTDAEKSLIDEWFLQHNEPGPDLPQEKAEKIGQEILKRLPRPGGSGSIIKLWSIIAAAASISLISISLLMVYQKSKKPLDTYAQDITPGGNKATLSLPNGKTLKLSEAKTGIIIDSRNITYQDGSVISSSTGNGTGMATITTPKGGQYQVILPDGSKVYLNAKSSLKYSLSFAKNGQRKIILLGGEAYFEVAKDQKRPFVVSTGNQQVQVLGTQFNIHAYPGETAIKTTLIEGSVKVTTRTPAAGSSTKTLQSGEQSVNTNGSLAVQKVNLKIAMAWKKGKIQFVKEELKTVMEMLSRWYDIQVVYDYYPADGQFTGSISRTKNISEVLSLLETTGDVHFKIEGRKVVVMK